MPCEVGTLVAPKTPPSFVVVALVSRSTPDPGLSVFAVQLSRGPVPVLPRAVRQAEFDPTTVVGSADTETVPVPSTVALRKGWSNSVVPAAMATPGVMTATEPEMRRTVTSSTMEPTRRRPRKNPPDPPPGGRPERCAERFDLIILWLVQYRWKLTAMPYRSGHWTVFPDELTDGDGECHQNDCQRSRNPVDGYGGFALAAGLPRPPDIPPGLSAGWAANLRRRSPAVTASGSCGRPDHPSAPLSAPARRCPRCAGPARPDPPPRRPASVPRAAGRLR